MERRKGLRRSVNFEVLMSTCEQNNFILQAVDASDFGIYVLTEGLKGPPLGALVKVKLSGYDANNSDHPLLNMVIKRVDSRGLGLQYIDSAG